MAVWLVQLFQKPPETGGMLVPMIVVMGVSMVMTGSVPVTVMRVVVMGVVVLVAMITAGHRFCSFRHHAG